FIEQKIIEAFRKMLAVRVNEIFREWEYLLPVIEFGTVGNFAVSPTISLASCERTEKERIIRQDAYSLSISFTLQEHDDGELYCYGYAYAFGKALGEDVTLGGIADRVVITGKKYLPPKKPNCGEGWGLVLSLRVNVEGIDV
ncbi:MAG: hypothetical protein LBC80_01105, partial [Treponema sp.]|nr:hypothetical protein [Treponema sp.]